jgi:hypothetical protein
MVAWARSRFYCDLITFAFGGNLYDVVSLDDRVCWRLRGERQQWWFGWQRINVTDLKSFQPFLADIDQGPGSIVIPYWWRVAPPTLLAAYLLLGASKRKSDQA